MRTAIFTRDFAKFEKVLMLSALYHTIARSGSEIDLMAEIRFWTVSNHRNGYETLASGCNYAEVHTCSNGRQTVLKGSCNHIYSRYGRYDHSINTDTILGCGWCDQKLSDARETLSNLNLVEQIFIMIFPKYKVDTIDVTMLLTSTSIQAIFSYILYAYLTQCL